MTYVKSVLVAAIIQKAQFVRVGPFPMISEVIIVKSGDSAIFYLIHGIAGTNP